MNKQKTTIKILGTTIILQILLFVIYYLYNTLDRTNHESNLYLTGKEKVSLPISLKFDKEIKSKAPLPISYKYDKEIDSKITQKKLVKKLKRIAPHKTEDIVSINNKFVKPILYTKSIKLSKLSIQEKKQKFIDMMIPSILVAKQKLKYEREKVAKLILQKDISDKDKKWLAEKREMFHASNNEELYNKMETHPTSIIIAQAIIESGWGTSKFFQKANNVFGVWSFDSEDNRVSASKKRGKRTIYLKKYQNIEESIYDYLLTLSKKDVYKEFQKKRLETKDPYELANYLTQYSEEREVYTKRVKDMIKINKLARYDKYQLDL